MACFRDERDYGVFQALLGSSLSEAGCLLHAYCLMTNHVHLLVTPRTREACSLLMKVLSHRYAQYFNKKYGRTGTLWEGRYRSSVVETGEYLMACHRYIEMNPVKAGMAATPAAYPWSSFAGNTGLRADSLLTAHTDMVALGALAYLELTGQALQDTVVREIENSLVGGYPIGGSAFRDALRKQTARRLERRKPGPQGAQVASKRSVPDPDLLRETNGRSVPDPDLLSVS